jgi:hypothetical protein
LNLVIQRRLAGELAEPVDPLDDRWVRREEPGPSVLELLDRVREVEVLGRPVRHLEDFLVGRDDRERPLEAVRVAGQLHGRRVGEVLALAAHGELYEPGGNRREDRQDDRDDEDKGLEAAAAPIARRGPSPRDATPERRPEEEIGEQGDTADEDADQEREPDVEVPDVRELVPDDALELLAVELLSPDVIATDAWAGSRPVANALGALSSMR